MVNLYCSLLFSRKEAIKFSEAALVSVHCNCLIGWIVIVRGYRPRNTINTIMDICLLVNNVTKKKQNVKFGQVFFYQSFGYTKGNSRSLTKRQPDSLDVNHKLFQVRPEVHREHRNNVGSHSMTERISEIRAGNSPIVNVMCYPTVSLTPKVYQKQLTI